MAVQGRFILRLGMTRVPPTSRVGTCPWRFAAARLVLPEKEHKSMINFLNPPITRGHDPLRTRPASSFTVWPR